MSKIFNARHSDTAVDLALFINRIGIAGMMLVHGVPKLEKLLSGNTNSFPDVIGLGSTTSLALTVFAEVICSVAILLGLATRLAVIPLIITMLVAVFIVHGEDPFGKQELGLHYLLSYVLLLLCGGGRFSVDALINRRPSRGRR